MKAEDGSEVELSLYFNKNAQTGSFVASPDKTKINNPGIGEACIVSYVRHGTESRNQGQSGTIYLVRDGNVLEITFTNIPTKDIITGQAGPELSGTIEAIIQ
jgi:hypothetical protein